MTKNSKHIKNLRSLGEFGLISRLNSKMTVKSTKTLLGNGDDAAIFQPSTGTSLAVSCDSLVEGVHFDLSLTSSLKLGRKAVSANLSDMASIGAKPVWLLISLSIPSNFPYKSLDGLYEGVNQVCKEHQIELAGGDTTRSPKGLGLHITILGETKKNRWFPRSSANPGDALFVTGSLGDSALGLKILQSKHCWKGTKKDLKYLAERHLNPTPRLSESQILSKMSRFMGAMIDISDGLTQDLNHLCKASNVGVEVEEKKLPLSQEFKKIVKNNSIPSKKLIFSGGEDYELLFTFRPQSVKKLMNQFQKAAKRITRIGTITNENESLVFLKSDGTREIIRSPEGFNHFTK